MGYLDSGRFLKVALSLRMIGVTQFNEFMEILERDPTKDVVPQLLEKGYINSNQYEEIISSLGKKSTVSRQKSEAPSSAKEKEVSYSEHYSVKGILGQGGMGCVFLGFDKNIGRSVAIKEIIIDEDDPEKKNALGRFVREARITGQLEHPGIVPVYELGKKEDGTTFYVMKYVKGKTFFAALKDCESKREEDAFRKRMLLFDHFIDVCEAVSYAHSKGIVHRDLKPGNIVLGEFGETIILDWGTAKMFESEPASIGPSNNISLLDFETIESDDLTRHGQLLGTPSYMSPEQVDSSLGAVDPRSDVFALGTNLFMLLTGKKPHRGTAGEIMSKIASADPSPAPRLCGNFIPPELDAITQKAMSKRKDDRFCNAQEMLSELKAYRDGRLVSVYAYTKGELFRRFISRNRVAVLGAVAVLMSILIGAGFSVNFAAKAHKARLASEKALVDVAAYSESAIALAINSVNELNLYFKNFTSDMRDAANKLSRVNLSSAKIVGSELENFFRLHSESEAVLLYAPSGQVNAVYPEFRAADAITVDEFKKLANKFKESDVIIGNESLKKEGLGTFQLYLPVYKGSGIGGIFSVVAKAEKSVTSALSFDPLASDYQVWVMKKDGNIVYDEDPKQIGRNLLSDEMYSKFPELLSFGKRMQNDPWGVGIYKFFGRNEKLVYKIAAWETFAPVKDVNWKMVITYPYVIK